MYTKMFKCTMCTLKQILRHKIKHTVKLTKKYIEITHNKNEQHKKCEIPYY